MMRFQVRGSERNDTVSNSKRPQCVVDTMSAFSEQEYKCKYPKLNQCEVECS